MPAGVIPARSPGSAPSTSPMRDMASWRSLSTAGRRTRGRTARASTLVRAVPSSGASRRGTGPDGAGPDGWIRIERPRGQLEDFIRTVRQAAQDTDAEYQALLARRRESALREARTQRERQADPARRAPPGRRSGPHRHSTGRDRVVAPPTACLRHMVPWRNSRSGIGKRSRASVYRVSSYGGLIES